MRMLVILLGLILVAPATLGDMYCNGNGGQGLCCIAEGGGESKDFCITQGQACSGLKAPKSCRETYETADYCYCKSLQACSDACTVSNSTGLNYPGEAVWDMHEECGDLVRKIAGEDTQHDLRLCYKTDKADYPRIQKNCGEFVKDFCDKIRYEE